MMTRDAPATSGSRMMPERLRDAATDTAAARSLNNRLRGTEAHLAQYGPVLVTNPDASVYLAWGALLPDQVDTEPYERLTPQSRLPAPLQALDEASLDFANDALLRRCENQFAEYGQQVLGGDDEPHLLARANFAGFQRQHDLQVVWLDTSRQWMVFSGGIRTWAQVGGDLVHEDTLLPTARFKGSDGWIVLVLEISPAPATYSFPQPAIIRLVGMELLETPTYEIPVRTLHAPAGSDWPVIWDGSKTYLPVARVTPPSGGSPPQITQLAFGSYDFAYHSTSGNDWLNNLPRPIFDDISAP